MATSQFKLSRGCTHAWPFWITKSSKQFDGSYLQTNIMKHSLSVKAILWKRWRWNIDKDLMLSVLNQRDLRNADSKKCRCSLRVHHVNIVQTFENVNSRATVRKSKFDMGKHEVVPCNFWPKPKLLLKLLCNCLRQSRQQV